MALLKNRIALASASFIVLACLVWVGAFAQPAFASEEETTVETAPGENVAMLAATEVEAAEEEYDESLAAETPQDGDEQDVQASDDLVPAEAEVAAADEQSAAMQATATTQYDTPFEAGEYVIESALGGYVLDVAGGSTADGGNVQIYSYNGTDAQKWRLSFDAQGLYTIISKKSGKALDLSGAQAKNGSNVQQYKGNSTDAQKWQIVKTSSGYKIVSAVNEKFVLDVAGARAADATNVWAYEANGTKAQSFTFTLVAKADDSTIIYDTPLEDGDYVIQSGLGGQYVLDVSGGSTSSGANVQLYSYNGTDAQKWRLSFDAQGLYTIISKKSGKALDLSGAQAKNGSNVQQYTGNSTKAQKWIIAVSNGKYTIASAVDPLMVIDVSGARAANGTNVQAYFGNGTAAQLFAFTSLAPSLPTDVVISDGVYAIAAASNNKFVLDVSGGSTSNAANVQLYQSNDTNAQRWGVIRNSSGLYSIFNMASGKMLDVAGASIMAGTNVQQYASNDSKAQLWALTKSGSAYTLLSAVSGLALDIAGGAIANGSNVQTYTSNGTNAQKFSLVSKPLIEERTYSVLSMRNPDVAIDVPGGSVTDGAKLQVYADNDSLAQHIVVAGAGNGAYTMQVVGSGKYLTSEGGAITQRSARADGTQQWSVSLVKGGLQFKNGATNTFLCVASTSPKNGTALTAASSNSNNTGTFNLVTRNLISEGLYTFVSMASSSGRVLDVAAGSWSNGANAQLYAANNSNAQKFVVSHVKDGYYKIAMALSGQALEVASGSKSAGANVDLYSWNGTDAQLWKPVLVDGGLTFQNKGSQLLLEVAGGKDANGTNVDQAAASQQYSQKWLLNGASVNYGDMASIAQLVRSASGSFNITASFSIASAQWNALVSAVSACQSRGFDVGFIMTDLQSGNYVSLNADRVNYAASTLKGAYVTWIFQEFIETGRVSWDSISGLIVPTVVDSNNDTYGQLRNRFGSDGFNSWLGAVGLGGWGEAWYPFYTARDLQLVWVRMMQYEQSGGAYVNTWRQTFSHSYYSTIHDELGGEKTTYSKPGWYPRSGDYGALNDSGIVIGSDGRRYLLTLLTNINCYGDEWAERNIVRALNTIFDSSPAYK